jgi:two-component system response regulator AtoC
MSILALTAEPRAMSSVAAALSDVPLVVAPSVSAGLQQLREPWSLVLLDAALESLALPLVERLHADGRRVGIMTRSPTLELTIEALRRGAREVFTFPPEPGRLREVAEGCDEQVAAAAADARGDDGTIIGQSPALLDAFRTVGRVANSPATVLIRGESGTGKELLARVLHEHSTRKSRPFVAVNCAAIPENLLESELFGHEKGAFTGALGRRVGRIERAAGGSLFLDEIGDMSLALQAKMLRALQEREIERVGGEAPIRIDVRVIAATNRNLEDDVAAGRFREDLYYRLAVVQVVLPPLRERGDDVRRLAEHYLTRAASEFGRPVRQLDPRTLAALCACNWPGNVRQLRNAIERAVLMAEGTVLRPTHLPAEIVAPSPRRTQAGESFGTLEEMERRYIGRVLEQTNGHMARAAEVLGIHRNTLRRKLEQYGLA